MKLLEDKKVVKKIKKGNLESFSQWVLERKEKFYKIAWSYLYNHQDVEDVFQNTIIKVYENIGSLKKEEYFETWVTSIFLNECRKILRVKKREYITEKVSIMSEERVRDMDFYDRLSSLNEIYKDVLILKYIVGYSESEISSIMKIPIGTVKSRTHRGLKMLKSQLEEVEL